MSYILDALRKSDQQRRRGAAPTLLPERAAATAPKQPAFLFYALFAVVLVGAGIVIGLLHPWQPEQPAAASGSIAAKPLELTSRQTAPTPLAVLPEMPRKTAQELPVRKSTSTAQSAPGPARAATKENKYALSKTGPRDTPGKADAAVPPQTATPIPEKPVATPAADAAQESRVMTMAELPLSIQQEIPRMSISVHAFSSKPRDRLVGINDRLLREGGTVAPGLTLEQITPDGMIFGYKGYRFRRGVQSSGAKVGNQ